MTLALTGRTGHSSLLILMNATDGQEGMELGKEHGREASTRKASTTKNPLDIKEKWYTHAIKLISTQTALYFHLRLRGVAITECCQTSSERVGTLVLAQSMRLCEESRMNVLASPALRFCFPN